MKKSIWILCLALTIAGFFAFCETVYAQPTFGSDSSTLTNPYMPGRLSDRLTYRSYGWPSVYYQYVDMVAKENIDQVECLKIKVTYLDSTDIEYYWLAQDTSGSIWMLQYQDVELETYGRNGAILVMPSQVSVGSILWGEETVVATGVTVPQLSTGFGPYTNCIKTMIDWGDGDIDYYYYAPDVGSIKAEWNDDGGINGFEISGVGRQRMLNDFDGDGKSDVLWRHSAGAVAMWLMNGYSIRQNMSPATVDLSYQIKGVGDFDGDGKADILWQNTAGAVVIWKMNGLSITGMGCPATVDSSWQIKGIGDFDGDGKSDILWQHSSGALAIWLMNGYTIRQNMSPATVDSSYQIKGVGDFDGDGKADILWQNTAGAVVIWKMNGMTISGMGCPATVDNSWQIKAIGDFDGDGKSDVLWQNSGGAVAMWLMNGFSIRQNQSPATVDTSYQIKGAADFDGDGKSDILWQHSGGAVVIWKMNGLSITGMGCPATVDSSWQIKAP
jgi:hypothetical protein